MSQLQTVTGPISAEEMGVTLVHEHLFNDLSSVVDEPYYGFSKYLVDQKVRPGLVPSHSTVTDFARLRGLSMSSLPHSRAM